MQDPKPTTRTIPASLAVLIAAGTLVVGLLLGRAWGGSGEAIPTLSVPVPSPIVSTVATAGPSGVTPTSTPVAGSVTVGQASLSLSGGINTVVSFGRLATPAEWTPPPGTLALSWSGPGAQVLTLEGASFTSQIATDTEHRLSFTVNVDGAPVAFSSTAGECTVTISPALPTQMGGSFLCTNLSSADDAVSVNAQGSFSATG
ncbi:MAG: hypothetical protein ACXWYQ_10430 [Actinomycetota bacterium]